MLSQLNRYAGCVAKIKVMKRQLLKPSDYDELLSKNSVSEVAAYLKNNTAYNKALSDITESTVHRGQLEKILQKSGEQGFVKVARFLNFKDKSFLHIYILENEIELLKKLVRMEIISRIEVTDLLVNPYYLKYYSFNPAKLAGARSREEFKEILKPTPYYKLLEQFLTGEDPDLFKIEMILDAYYYRNFWKAIKKRLEGSEQAVVQQFAGSEIDMLNIMWVIRCKKFFDIPKELIYSFLLPVNYRLKKQQLVDMVESGSLQQAQDILADTVYSHLINDEFPYFELMYETMGIRLLRKLAKLNGFSIIQLLYYFRCKTMEIENLIKIIEGIRYDVDKKEIAKYLIMTEVRDHGS